MTSEPDHVRRRGGRGEGREGNLEQRLRGKRAERTRVARKVQLYREERQEEHRPWVGELRVGDGVCQQGGPCSR